MLNLVYISVIHVHNDQYLDMVDGKALFPTKGTQAYDYIVRKLDHQYVLVDHCQYKNVDCSYTFNYNIHEKWQKNYFKKYKIMLHVLSQHNNHNFISALQILPNKVHTVYCLMSYDLYQTMTLNNKLYASSVLLIHLPTYQLTANNVLHYFPTLLLQQQQVTIKDNPLRSLVKAYDDFDSQYILLIKQLLLQTKRQDRTNCGTHSIFAYSISCHVGQAFPLLRIKKTSFVKIVQELLFFIVGKCDSNILQQQDNCIWQANTTQQVLTNLQLPYQSGDMGPMYPHQWRHAGAPYIDCHAKYEGIDQLQQLINGLIKDPYSRRHLLVNWAVADLPAMVLAPCHVLAQYYVTDGYLDCQVYQRSADVILGLPFNVASYTLLQYMLADICNYTPRLLTFCLGDAHVYHNHIAKAEKLITRDISCYSTPTVTIAHKNNINDYQLADFTLHNYQSASAMAFQLNV